MDEHGDVSLQGQVLDTAYLQKMDNEDIVLLCEFVR